MRPGAYPTVEHLKGASLGLTPALPANIRLGWKGLPGTNALAYYEKNVTYGRKKFCNIGHRLQLLGLWNQEGEELSTAGHNLDCSGILRDWPGIIGLTMAIRVLG